MLHFFKKDISHIALPEKFTYPFHYTPHPLCEMAAEEVQTYLTEGRLWERVVQKGKMFGVMVVKTPEGQIGYLASFSGNLGKRKAYTFFVPPILNLLKPRGFFRDEEDKISQINEELAVLESAPEYLRLQQKLVEQKREWKRIAGEQKKLMKEAKDQRNIRRGGSISLEEDEELRRESQQDKIRYKNLQQKHQAMIAAAEADIVTYEKSLQELKNKRQSMSNRLQMKIFKRFRVSNYFGAEENIYNIFKETINHVPPAGAGDCAAPKLLQYAYQHQLEPIAMAEFWWGDSPASEIRHQGYYYPACKEKCGPLLQYMLQGIEVEDNPLESVSINPLDIEIVYEDKSLLIIDKPANLLSVPGKETSFSVCEWAQTRYPQATGPMIVHRLDMATSGLMIVAKTTEAYLRLQKLFEARDVKKRYIAILDGVLPEDKDRGFVSLPICPDPTDRPRQIVNAEYGKASFTLYEVLSCDGNRTRVAFYPLTGRTHQLRVHASHPAGLDCPIVGDTLYGKSADRLYLHAEYLEFKHPMSHKIIRVEKKAPF